MSASALQCWPRTAPPLAGCLSAAFAWLPPGWLALHKNAYSSNPIKHSIPRYSMLYLICLVLEPESAGCIGGVVSATVTTACPACTWEQMKVLMTKNARRAHGLSLFCNYRSCAQLAAAMTRLGPLLHCTTCGGPCDHRSCTACIIGCNCKNLSICASVLHPTASGTGVDEVSIAGCASW